MCSCPTGNYKPAKRNVIKGESIAVLRLNLFDEISKLNIKAAECSDLTSPPEADAQCWTEVRLIDSSINCVRRVAPATSPRSGYGPV